MVFLFVPDRLEQDNLIDSLITNILPPFLQCVYEGKPSAYQTVYAGF